jgi:hypothetical protein
MPQPQFIPSPLKIIERRRCQNCGATNSLRRGDNRAANFRVELRALEPACTASYVAINVLYWA